MKAKRVDAISTLEAAFLFQIKALKLPEPVREHRFHSARKWRFDFAWPEKKLAVEIQGGIYSNGRHVRGAAMEKEYEKFGEAMKLGWTVYQCGPNMIKSWKAIETVEALLAAANKSPEG